MYRRTRTVLVLIIFMLPLHSFAGDSVPETIISIRFDLDNHTLKGTSRITLNDNEHARVHISGLKVMSASIDGLPLVVESGAEIIEFAPENPGKILQIEYEAAVTELPESDVSDYPGVIENNLIGIDGIVLLNDWYPHVDGLSLYNLTAVVPREFEAISEAEEISVTQKTDLSREFTFIFPYPVDQINFIAGLYDVERIRHNETDIYTYFLPDDGEFSQPYREHTKRYIDMYEDLFGAYPFKRFSVVENLLPTGYSMPTFTLLGKDVVKLPFIVETSLGHEILHQWFGNFVYADHARGNWSEGLTTYLADHRYKEREGKGWAYRKQSLIDFQSYITSENDSPLKSFSTRIDRVSGAIGYSKSAMVFHMLRNLTGEETFVETLRLFIEDNKFTLASWKDIENAFESSSGHTLDWFFRQWVEEEGIPKITLKHVDLAYHGAHSVVSFDILQGKKTFKLHLPVLVKTDQGEIRKTFEIEEHNTSLEIEVDGQPVELIIDEQYDIFRELLVRESPPVLSKFLGDASGIFIVPEGEGKSCADIAQFFIEAGCSKKEEHEITYDDLTTSSLMIPGTDTNLAKKLFGKRVKPVHDFSLVVKNNPFNERKVIVLIDASSSDNLYSYAKKIRHYGTYSSISFDNGVNTSKILDTTEKGIRRKLVKDIVGVELPRITKIPDIIEKISDKKVIYVGETHDQFEHHRVQLEIIRRLHKKNKNIAIAMEMFQKPFQNVLDDFIEGTLDEKNFLKKSEYFKRWGFDYNLYREILLYAREYAIPVIALNIDRKIVSKVSSDGLLSLSEEDMKDVPEHLDLSDSAYRMRLKDFFDQHRNAQSRNFDFFYQAQVLWDETMAHNLDAFMKNNPDHQVIVIAGGGHMAFASGIPKRAYRLNQEEYAVILNSEAVEDNIADFILFPEPIRTRSAPKLMVFLEEYEGKVTISGFTSNSVSEKAGLRKGDIIVSIDDVRIEEIDDVKIFLFDKKNGDSVTVKVLRKVFLFATAEKELTVTL